jgi:hypothetical protein
MPIPSSTSIEFGDALTQPGILQPNTTIHIDAYGVAQGQATFALDSANVNIQGAIAYYTAGADWPDSLGFNMKSYKYSLSSSKGGITMITVDYMGIQRGTGYSDCQITGVANTTAQPIETHPNFTKVTDSTIGNGSLTQILAGYYTKDKAHLTTANCPLFAEVKDNEGKSYTPHAQYKFIGFGTNGAGDVNIKAGIRQFLRPMWNVRGVVFFDSENGARATKMTNAVGRTIKGFGDLNKLITPDEILGYVEPQMCLLTNASVECIGRPSNYAALKVTYDIMVGGEIGWDEDIYGKAQESIFA